MYLFNDWQKFYDEQLEYTDGLGGKMKIIGRRFGELAGTWCICHKIDVKPRWKSRNTVGEDAEFIRALRKEEKTTEAEVGGYIIMHMSGYIDF